MALAAEHAITPRRRYFIFLPQLSLEEGQGGGLEAALIFCENRLCLYQEAVDQCGEKDPSLRGDPSLTLRMTEKEPFCWSS
jgi:hypothetical protein